MKAKIIKITTTPHLIKFWSLILIFSFFITSLTHAQTLKLKPRKTDAMTGSEFAKSISDTALTLQKREEIIFKEIKSGNIPDFLRKLKEIKQGSGTNPAIQSISYYVLPDYFCIGSNDDFFYVPMTPILAQKVADLTKCSLPTKKMVDTIYKNANIKLRPQPIPPTKAMTTVPIFIMHSDSVQIQLKPYLLQHNRSELTAGNKKDMIISNKIYGEKTPRVVIYGWHQLNGKAIQPVYNKHTNLWADYSHGIRLVQNKVWLDGKKTTLKKILADPKLNLLISDEGPILNAQYPIFESY